MGELIDALRPRQVAEREFSKINEPAFLRERIADEIVGRLGDQYLTAAREASDSGTPIHLGAEVVVAAHLWLAGVQRHPNGECDALRPRLVCEGVLEVERGRNGVGSEGECAEEAVALAAVF